MAPTVPKLAVCGVGLFQQIKARWDAIGWRAHSSHGQTSMGCGYLCAERLFSPTKVKNKNRYQPKSGSYKLAEI